MRKGPRYLQKKTYKPAWRCTWFTTLLYITFIKSSSFKKAFRIHIQDCITSCFNDPDAHCKRINPALRRPPQTASVPLVRAASPGPPHIQLSIRTGWSSLGASVHPFYYDCKLQRTAPGLPSFEYLYILSLSPPLSHLLSRSSTIMSSRCANTNIYCKSTSATVRPLTDR